MRGEVADNLTRAPSMFIVCIYSPNRNRWIPHRAKEAERAVTIARCELCAVIHPLLVTGPFAP